MNQLLDYGYRQYQRGESVECNYETSCCFNKGRDHKYSELNYINTVVGGSKPLAELGPTYEQRRKLLLNVIHQ